MNGLKISELDIGELGVNDWVPIERDNNSNYRISLKRAITGSVLDDYGTVRIGLNAATGVGNPNIIAIGSSAGQRVSGSDNIFIGENAGSGITSGSFNTFIGDGVGSTVTSIDSSVLIGRNAGTATDPGNNCVLIGNNAKTSDVDSNSIVIGYNAIGAGANTAVLGGDSITDTYLKGTVHANAINASSIFGATDITSDDATFEYVTVNALISFGNEASLSYSTISPESVVSAYSGSMAIDSRGGLGRKIYVKESGVGSNGWFPIGSVPSTYITGTTSSLTPNAKLYSQYSITGLASAIIFNNPTDGLVDGKRLTLRYIDTGVSKSISWGGAYRAIGVTLPSATTPSKLSYIQCIYNSASSVWDVTSVQTQA